MTKDNKRQLQLYGALALAASFGLVLLVTCAQATGYGDGPRAQWFKSLKNDTGVLCCDLADGARIPQDHVKQVGTTWYVLINSVWVEVPESAVVKTSSIDGEPYLFMRYDGKTIRCFVAPVPGY